MGAERELIYLGLLPAQVKDSDLRIRNASAEARLGVRLVLAVAVAGREHESIKSVKTAEHCYFVELNLFIMDCVLISAKGAFSLHHSHVGLIQINTGI